MARAGTGGCQFFCSISCLYPITPFSLRVMQPRLPRQPEPPGSAVNLDPGWSTSSAAVAALCPLSPLSSSRPLLGLLARGCGRSTSGFAWAVGSGGAGWQATEVGRWLPCTGGKRGAQPAPRSPPALVRPALPWEAQDGIRWCSPGRQACSRGRGPDPPSLSRWPAGRVLGMLPLSPSSGAAGW